MSPRAKQSTLCIPPGDDPGGATPFERFDNIMGRILSTSKADVDRRMREHECSEAKKRRRRRRRLPRKSS
jgi:hypothetical protein